jgi:hypothetical protein
MAVNAEEIETCCEVANVDFVFAINIQSLDQQT